jgi:Fe/S biogenesis protein NfuA
MSTETTVLREGIPAGFNGDAPVLAITEEAKAKIRAVLDSQNAPSRCIRVSAPARGRFAMNLEPDGRPGLEDVVLPYDGFEIFVDPQSYPLVEGASLDWLDTPTGGGFKFDNPNLAPKRPERRQPPEGPEGDDWRRIQEILDEEVNPAVASHGGYIDLLEYREGVAYVEMRGGCQGCGMASVTLKQGVEQILKGHLPDLKEILDVTDHDAGRNPYYAPSSK